MTKNITALIYATLGTIWFTVLVTIWAEFSEPFKNSLKAVTGHHWTTKSIFAVILFFLLYFVFLKTKESTNIKKSINFVLLNTILGGLALFIFFIWHFLR
ncbi:MAG: hypothetical protein G01um101420_693 [Parcubacteria group bacterium Gr01-1014_20]|nr:MAG: hypothetical protein G01um101420_693 [Parcubacteria group bacterium Gr01-1014_20]